MPRIETYKRQVLPPSGGDYPRGSFMAIRTAGMVGSAIDDAGRAVSNFGGAMADVAIKQHRAQEALDISSALSDLQKRTDDAYQKNKMEVHDPALFESRIREDYSSIAGDILGKQTKGVAKRIQPFLNEYSARIHTRAKADAIQKQVELGNTQRIDSEDTLRNSALEGYKRGDFEAGYEASQNYDALLALHKDTGLIGPDDAMAESMRFKKNLTRDGYLLAIQNDPENVLQRLQDKPDPLLDPFTHQELIGTAGKAVMQFQEAQQKAEKDSY